MVQELIYNPDVPELMAVWHRVDDCLSALRSVKSARISPDERVAVSTFGPAIRVWRVADGTLLWEKDHNAEIECVTFSPDSRRFVTGDEDFSVIIRDTQTGRELKKIEVNSSLDGITWPHDGQLIAAGSAVAVSDAVQPKPSTGGLLSYVPTGVGLGLDVNETKMEKRKLNR